MIFDIFFSMYHVICCDEILVSRRTDGEIEGKQWE